MSRIVIKQGDITTCAVDAIVNAANNDLQLGGGVAGAIARAGGPAIQAECDRHGPVELGQAALTTAGNLPAQCVIHQASMRLGGQTTGQTLKRSTEAVLDIAQSHRLQSLAFPAVGTGIAGFDTRRCAEIMLELVRQRLDEGSSLREVQFVLFDQASYEIFRDVAQQLGIEAG